MALFSMDINNLQDLFVEQLRDLYDGEQQIVDALPKMIEKATNPQLQKALSAHLQETRMQIDRLEQIFTVLGKDASGETCKGMKGVIKEGDDLVSKSDPGVIDASIITSCQRVEHYEMAGYGTARRFAQQLGRPELAQLLQHTLNEEKNADQMLSEIAETTNIEAQKAA